MPIARVTDVGRAAAPRLTLRIMRQIPALIAQGQGRRPDPLPDGTAPAAQQPGPPDSSHPTPAGGHPDAMEQWSVRPIRHQTELDTFLAEHRTCGRPPAFLPAPGSRLAINSHSPAGRVQLYGSKGQPLDAITGGNVDARDQARIVTVTGGVVAVTDHGTVDTVAGGHVTASGDAVVAHMVNGTVHAYDAATVATVTGGDIYAHDRATIGTVEDGQVIAGGDAVITWVRGGAIGADGHAIITRATGGIISVGGNATITASGTARIYAHDDARVIIAANGSGVRVDAYDQATVTCYAGTVAVHSPAVTTAGDGATLIPHQIQPQPTARQQTDTRLRAACPRPSARPDHTPGQDGDGTR